MNNQNKAELRRLAEDADQSTWGVGIPDTATVNPRQAALLIGPSRSDMDRMVAYVAEDARYIAAARPAAILSLLDENDKLRAEVEALRQMLLEASEEIDGWGSYASKHFRDKHDLEGTVARFHQAAMTKEGSANGKNNS